MLGIAPSELMRLELREFYAAYEGWSHLREQAMREGMERARWHAAATISPHIKDTGKSMIEMLPLPWDSKVEPEVSIDDRRRRVEELMQRIKSDE